MRVRVRGLASLLLLGIMACSGARPKGNFGWGLGEPPDRTGAAVLAVRWHRTLTPETRHAYIPVETSVPAVDDATGTLYVPSVQGSLYALRADGTRVYRLEMGTPLESHPALDSERDELYFGTERAQLVALQASTGRIRWRTTTTGAARRRPVLTEDAVFVVTESDAVEAFDRRDGSVLWRYERELGEGFLVAGHAGLTLEGPHLYTAFNDGAVVCLNVVDGSERWTQETARDAPVVEPGLPQYLDVDTTPLVQGDTVYAASFGAGLYALNRGNGSVLWRMSEWTGIVGLSPAPGGLVVSSADRGVARIDAETQAVRWNLSELRGTATPPTTADGAVLFGESHGSFIALDLETGLELSRVNTEYGFEAQPALSPRGLGYVMTNGGMLLALRVAL